jgi:hypothetical protein
VKRKAKRVLIFIIEPYRPQIAMFKNLAKAMGGPGRTQPFDYIILHNDVLTQDGQAPPSFSIRVTLTRLP